MFLLDDYITSVALSSNGNHLLCGGSKGTVTVWDSITGEHILTREGHTAAISTVAWFPPPQKAVKTKRKSTTLQAESNVCDEIWTFTTSQNLNVLSRSASKSKSLINMQFSAPAYQFISIGSDDSLLAWSLDGIFAEPGLSPLITAVFNHTGEWLLTVGGASLSSNHRANTLIRLWETSTATVRCRIELPETQRSELIWASFFPKDDTRIVLGCKNGLVKVYRSRTGELVREFWADPETALSEVVLGYTYEWPFAATGTHVVGYSLHPEGKYIAVAVAGQERLPTQAAVVQDPKITYSLETAVQHSLDAAGLNDVAKMARRSVTDGTDLDKSSDVVLRDCIRVMFWDLEGNPLRLDSSFHLPVFYNAAELLLRVWSGKYPSITQPP
ncbi:WD40-repeat-containing domain protein [Chytridium lagenaria]|nr:WD40-repeat-containing domain protein [Chytridium lagenaria]